MNEKNETSATTPEGAATVGNEAPQTQGADGGVVGGNVNGGDGKPANGGNTGNSAAKPADGGNGGTGGEAKNADVPKTQEELNALIGAAVTSELTKARAAWEAEAAETARIAALPEEQQKAELDKRREDDLSKREQAIAAKELKYNAAIDFSKKGLPVELAEILDYASEESAASSAANVEKVFRETVRSAVEARLKTSTPGAGVAGSGVDPFNAAFGVKG